MSLTLLAPMRNNNTMKTEPELVMKKDIILTSFCSTRPATGVAMAPAPEPMPFIMPVSEPETVNIL